MKTSTITVLIFSLSCIFALATAKELSGDQKIQAKYLFIVVANGIRYDDALGNKNHLYAENIWTKLRPLGAICTKFYNRELTYPIPAQASLLTGVWNVFKDPHCDTIRPAVPTLFEYWKKKKSGAFCYFATGRKNQEVLSYSDYKEYGKSYAPVFDTTIANSIDTSSKAGVSTEDENAIYGKVTSYIFLQHPSFVYFNAGAGSDNEYKHDTLECKINDKNGGCGEADLLNAYYESIILTDSIVADLWNRIQQDSVYKDRSLFIFLSTHGRHTDDFRGYGDNCRGCQELNCLLIGPGVKKDCISKKRRALIDICPTMGMLLDIPTPYAKGKIMKELLE